LKPKFIALNMLLVLALGAIAWQGRVRLHEARVKRRNNLAVKLTPLPAPPLTPTPKPDAAPATKYADVATKDLFSKDRNPNVVVDPPKVETPKPMPALPVVYGVLGLPSGTKAIMSEKAGVSGRAVRAGDTIGEFRIASLDPQNVVFDWDGKQIARKIEELIDRSSGPGGVQSAAGQPGGSSPSPQQQNNGQPVPAAPGKEMPGTVPGQPAQRACVPGDNSPAGTVVGGFRKNSVPTPFGAAFCSWVPVQ
jgi:hypothetical protein